MKIEKIVLAEGEKKPECCGKCVFIRVNRSNGIMTCLITKKEIEYLKIHKDCPIVEFNEKLKY